MGNIGVLTIEADSIILSLKSSLELVQFTQTQAQETLW